MPLIIPTKITLFFFVLFIQASFQYTKFFENFLYYTIYFLPRQCNICELSDSMTFFVWLCNQARTYPALFPPHAALRAAKQAGKKRSPAPSFALVRGKKGVGKMPQHQNRAWCWIKIFAYPRFRRFFLRRNFSCQQS